MKKILSFSAPLIYLASCLFLLWLGLNRLVARDEGFYLMAAKLVMDGNLPYLDFFYPQMPLFPYLYGIWLEIFGWSWSSARIFSSLLSIGCFSVLCLSLRNRVVPALACLGLLLFVCSELVVGWYPTAQTYSATTLLCLLAYYLIQREDLAHSTGRIVLVALLLGLTLNFRLFYLSILPLFALQIWYRASTARVRMRNLSYFAFGLALTLCPILILTVSDWSAVWFNNWGYHAVRSEMSAAEIYAHRVEMLSILAGVLPDERLDGWQHGFLFFGALLHAIFRLFQRRLPDLAFGIGLVLFVSSLLPVPIYLQYFCVSVPFFIISTILFVAEITTWVGSHKKILIPACLFFIAILVPYFHGTYAATVRYVKTGVGVASVRTPDLSLAQLDNVRSVSSIIREQSEPKEKVLAQWPGYLIESNASAYPGTENHFWIRAGDALDRADRKKYKVVNRLEYQQILDDPEVKLVVIEESRLKRFFPKNILRDRGFQKTKEQGGVLIYQRVGE